LGDVSGCGKIQKGRSGEMKKIKYQRSVLSTRPAVFGRELPRDWKREEDVSPVCWKELLGILVAVILFFMIPWGLHIVQVMISEVAK